MTRPAVNAKQWIRLADLTPNPRNPRTITEKQLAKLQKSVSEFTKGLALKPMILRKNKVILDGNMRYKCMVALGWEEIPRKWVVYSEDILKSLGQEPLTEEEEREMIIKANLHFGEIDWEMIFEGWEETETLEEWGLDIKWSQEPGADPMKKAKAEHIRHDHIDNIQTEIQSGDLITIGEHRLICGDSTQQHTWQRLLGDDDAALVLTDPPYNVDYVGTTKAKMEQDAREKLANDNLSSIECQRFAGAFIEALIPKTTPGTPWYIFYATTQLDWPIAVRSSAMGLHQKMIYELIWKKDQLILGMADYHYKHEGILYTWTPGAAHRWYGDRKQTTILEFARPARSPLHPTMKPIDLLERLMLNSSQPGDIVADGFGGSGSTMVTAQLLGRKAALVEYEPRYCQVIIDRMIDFEPGLPITINGKPYEGE